MRHGNKINHLGRKHGHRDALLKNMSISLIEHKRITTTLAKAKVLRTHLEPIITKVRQNTTHSRRVVFSYLQNKEAVKELFGIIADKIGDRPGGYLRIIKTGYRLGDAAPTALIEFVDFNDVYTKGDGNAAAAKKRTRRSGAAKKATVENSNVATPKNVDEEEIVDQVTDSPEMVEATQEEVVHTPEEIVEVKETVAETAEPDNEDVVSIDNTTESESSEEEKKDENKEEA